MALFESYERRIDQINAVLNKYGISSVEEAEKITKDAGLDVYEQVKKIQPICFENACWAYIIGAAIAIKKGCRKASEAAAAIGEGLQAHHLYKKGDGKMQDYIMEVMEKCGLASYFIHRYPHQFSGGQRQRIGIARALSLNPKFIVCDEPVSALDVSIQAQILNLLKSLQKELNLTLLFVGHGLGAVNYVSDRIAVMYLGRIVEIGDADEVYHSPKHPYTVSLLSAVPIPDPKTAKERQRIILSGDVPSPMNLPSGCAFRTRCPYATEKCAAECPSLTDRGDGHMVACWNK